MKYQEKQKWKRKAAAVLAILIALAMVVGLVTPFIAYGAQTTAVVPAVSARDAASDGGNAAASGRETEFGQEQFTLEAEVGFGGEFIVGKAALLQGIITNHGAAFRGELQAKVYTYEESGTGGTTEEYAVYYQDMELLEGASQKIEMEINMGTIRRFLQITLVDEKGNTVFLQNISLRAKAPNALATAILSGRPQDMQVLAGMMPPGTEQAEADAFYRTYFFDEGTFPATRALMDNFRIVVADGIDMAALSQEQRDALSGWVTDGGMLVLGTGETGARTLGGLGLSAGIAVSGTVSGSVQGTPATLAVLEGEGVEPLWQDGGTVLAYAKKAGEGRLILPAFSLSTAPMASLAETPAILWEACRMADSDYLRIADEDDRYYYRYSTLGSFPPMGGDTVKLLLGLLAAYVVVVGPILYLVLKKLDKREKGWVVVPAVAVVFMAGVLLVSKTSPYGKGMLRVVSTVELTEGAAVAQAQTTIRLKSADTGTITYTNEDETAFFPKLEDNYFFNLRQPGGSRCAYKVLAGGHTEIEFYDNQSWGTNQLSAAHAVETGGAMEQSLRLEDGRLVGTVTNGTNTGFVDSVVAINGIWLRIGPMQAGETVEVDQPAPVEEVGSYHMFHQLFYDDGRMDEWLPDMVREGKISRDGAFRIRSEQAMLENRLNNGYGGNMLSSGEMQMEFYGFSEAPLLESAGLLNRKEPFVSALTMYHQTFATELSKMGEFDIPFAIMPEAIETEQQYARSDGWGLMCFYLYDEGEVDLVYSIADGIDLELFQFEEIERNSLREKARIYNVSTGEWDILRTREYVAPGEYDPWNYISEDGKVRVRLYMMEGNEVEVPGMRVKGSGLLAGN